MSASLTVLLLLLSGNDPVKLRAARFAIGCGNCGVVVGVWDGGRSRVLGLGTVLLPGGERVPDGSTVFEIGSVTKTLTGILLADAVRRGEVKFGDPAAKYLPTDLKPPSADPDVPVTLEHLATHSSGLPTQPAFLALTARNPLNPYADLDRRKLAATLAVIEPSRKPGEAYRYSNLGAGLLGHALVRAAGADSFDALLRERVCKPLGLKDTAEALTGEQRSRFAQAFAADGTPVPHWDFATLAAGGGVRSTADDLLRFAAACLGRPKTELLPAIRDAMEPRRDVTARARVGLFWMTSTPAKGPKRVWHSGSTLGHRCILILVPDRNVAVVVLCSVGTPEVDRLGIDLATLVAG